jgi:hypothetical protein
VARKQSRQTRGVGAAPAAFAGDPEIGDDAACRNNALGIADAIVKMDEAEIKPRVGMVLPARKRRKIGVVAARFWYRRMQKIDAPPRLFGPSRS